MDRTPDGGPPARQWAIVAAALVGAALMVASCGSGDGGTSTNAGEETPDDLVTVEIPNLVGEDENFARGVLIGLGASPVLVYEDSSASESGLVIRVDQIAGSSIEVGSKVTIYVARTPTHEITGRLVLIDSGNEGSSKDCYGGGGYSDIDSRAQVTVRDDSGQVIGVTQLGTGYQSPEYPNVSCEFHFTISGLPEVTFYSISTGRRGELQFSFADLQATGWTINMDLTSS